jgi:hypothetical protein
MSVPGAMGKTMLLQLAKDWTQVLYQVGARVVAIVALGR